MTSALAPHRNKLNKFELLEVSSVLARYGPTANCHEYECIHCLMESCERKDALNILT